MKTSIVRRALAGYFLLMLFLIGACTNSSFHFRRSFNVSDTFENCRLIPGSTYYYSGLFVSPTAIVGIQPGYTLSSEHWHAIEMDEEKLCHMVAEIRNTAGVVPDNPEPHGARILSDRGENIGIWYSVYELPILTFKTDKEFYMSPPTFDIPGPNQDPI